MVLTNIDPTGNYRPRNIPFQENERITVSMPEDPGVIHYLKFYYKDAVMNHI